jgi:hypothetical protein
MYLDMGPQVQKAPAVAESKHGRESQSVLLVLVPGAFLYPKDYDALKKALETVSNELYRQKGIAVTLGVACPDWTKVDPANFSQSMDVVNEAIEETIAMVQSLEDSGFEIEKNVFGRYENVVVALHSVSALAAGLFPLYKAKHLILLGSNLVHASGLWPSLDTYPLSSLSIYGDLDGQSHAAKAAIALCAGRHKDCMRSHYFCMIPNCNHASFSNGVRNTLRGDIAITSPDVRLDDTAHAICNTIAQFLASEYAQSGEAREFLNCETEKTWKTLSPYLRELGRLPSDYDCSTSSISRSDGELERVLSYAAGREAATMASTSPELLNHPGELGRAEEFAIRAQQLILQPILGHTKCNIKVTAQVHTSQKNFMYSKARMCPEKSSDLHISVQCISNVQVQGTEFSMVSPFYALKLKSLKQVCIMLQHDVADDTETICEKLFNSSWKRAFDASANHIRERFTERGQPLICKEIHPSRAPDWVTSRPVLTPGCLEINAFTTKEEADTSDLSGCLYYQCPSVAWCMEYIMVHGLKDEFQR